ncbi:MAG: type II toxin-antitoxin system VapC family toxin [Limisphaerales bacterium]
MNERRCAVDTNILLRAADPRSVDCNQAKDAVIKLRSDGMIPVLFPQMLIEFWVAATRPVQNNGLGWDGTRAERELEQLLRAFAVLPEREEIFQHWRTLVTRFKVSGKRAHDARIAAAMISHGVPALLTFNSDDFSAFSDLSIFSPEKILGR